MFMPVKRQCQAVPAEEADTSARLRESPRRDVPTIVFKCVDVGCRGRPLCVAPAIDAFLAQATAK